MADVSINFAPSSRASATFWRDPKDHDRLVVEPRFGGCALLLGVPLLSIAAWLERSILTDDTNWLAVVAGIVLGSLGAFALFGRSRLVFDRQKAVLNNEILLLVRFVRSRRSLESANAVRIEEVFDAGQGEDSSPSTSFAVSVDITGRRSIDVAHAGSWEGVVPVAEAVAAFLRLPLNDTVVETVRKPDELDLPLHERENRKHGPAPDVPAIGKTEITIADGVVHLAYPPPDARGVLLMGAIVSVVWTLPLFLMGRLGVALLPLALITWSWFHLRFGMRSSVEIEGSTLRIFRHGIFVDRRREFPATELEDLAVRRPEWGGHRNVVAQMTEGYIVARSDTASAGFGWGLSKKELLWMRSYIVAALEPPRVPSERRIPEDDIPFGRPSQIAPLIGLIIGAIVARLAGGRLELSLAVPYLEHVINVGGLMGMVLAVFISHRGHRGQSSASGRVLVWGGVVLLASAVFYSSHPLLQPFPTFNEGVIARLPRPPMRFWIGWITSAAIPNTIAAAILLTLLSGASAIRERFRSNRSSNARDQPKPAVDSKRQELTAWVAFFLFGLPFLGGAIAIWTNALKASGSERIIAVAAGLMFFSIGATCMQFWRLVPDKWWPKDVDWGALIGVLAATGTGAFIILLSIFDDESQFPVGRLVATAAGATFFFVGIGILPAALPRFAKQLELVSWASISLGLTGFAISTGGVVLSGAWIFLLGFLMLAGIAAASWWGLFREIRKRVRARGSGSK